jgi:hypothetical protein
MKMKFYLAAGTVVTFILGYILSSQYFFGAEPRLSQANATLQQKGDLCSGIAENAVANFPAIVEFQKLEMLGRKANVMRRCMHDNGFKENPLWVKYAAPIAKKNAQQLSISEDEALENLKREAMYIFFNANHQPLYWQALNQK